MAYSSWSVVFGEQPSATKWNILGTNDASFNDGTGIAGLYKDLLTVDSNPYKFSVYRNSAFTIGNLGFDKVSFDTETFDTNNNFATGTYTAPVNGFYHFDALVSFETISGSGVEVSIYKNGSGALMGNGGVPVGFTGGFNTRISVSGLLQLTATNTVDVYCYGAGNTGNPGVTDTYFMGYLVSRT